MTTFTRAKGGRAAASAPFVDAVIDRMPAEPVPGHRVAVAGATKRYGDLAALDNVTLEIEPGRFTVLLGPSGSGKSTLVRSIAGIERLDSGTVHLHGVTMSERGRHVAPERRDLAMVFQDYALWPHMTARENVAFAIKRRRHGGVESRLRVAEALDRVGLAGKLEHYPHELSGGEQQRVALARAIVGRPALLLFDEPLSNLDADLRERLRVEISTITRESGATALYITHDQSEAFALADEVGVLRAGRIEQFGPPEEIYRHPATPFVARFTGLAGSFAGRVVHARHGAVTVSLGDHLITCSGPEFVGGLADVTILIRPTATSLAVDPGPGSAVFAQTGASQDAPRPIPAIIRDVAYRGRGYEHVVETAYGTLSAVFDANRWERGTRCVVQIDPEACVAFASSVTE